MAHSNNLGFQPYGDYTSIEDNRWRVNTTGMSDGQNGNLVIDAALKAEGSHRVGGWLLGGVPLYRDTDNTLKIFSAEAKIAGKKVQGFTFCPHKITDVNGEFYTESIPVAVQTRGEVICQWLPVVFDPADLPAQFSNTVL
ncbi:MAG: hypothetical protein PHW63_07950 [Alphaproteobacteria bacterium]|nr:hypothetical protein [Alphaproteobacteria bacterium]